MVTNDANDDAYARECQAILDISDQLTTKEIEDRFYQAADKSLPDDMRPKNIMLQEVYIGVISDELDPDFPLSNHERSLGRYRKIIEDYLAGNYYPTSFALSGNYTDTAQGHTWYVEIDESGFSINCGDNIIAEKLTNIANSIKLTGDDEADLGDLQGKLPDQIGNLKLLNSELNEYLT